MRKFPIAVIVLCLLVPGCGGDDEQDGSSSERASSSPTSTMSAAEEGLKRVQRSRENTRRAALRASPERYKHLGHEAAGRERASILTSVQHYADAIARRDWKEVCAMQSDAVLESYERQGESCERLNASVISKLPARYWRGLSHPEVTRVRVNGDEAIAFLTLKSGQELRWAFKDEGGAWQVGALLFD